MPSMLSSMKVHHVFKRRSAPRCKSRSHRGRLLVVYRRLFDAYDTVRALSQLVAAANATDDRALVTCAVLEDDLGSLLDECEELLIAEATLIDAELDSFVGRSETVLEEVALLLDQASSPQPTFSEDTLAV